MFEHMTFEHIIYEMLDRVPDDVDKREGSIIFDALAPTAMELAEKYSNMDLLMRRTFADSAGEDDLEKRVGEHGVKRKQASKAIRKGVFTNGDSEPFDVPFLGRFRLGNYVYAIKEKIEVGIYHLEAETEGVVGNQDFGELLPLEPIDGLGTATLTDVLIPGEDLETDESLYAKYLDHINEKAFGGNRADYKKHVLAIQGVGAVRLSRAPYGGGTSRATIIDSTFNVPTDVLVDFAQEIVDPKPYAGDGYGTAPIGHVVEVIAGESSTVDFETTLSLSGVTLGQIETLVEAVVDDYLAEIRSEWHRDLPLVIRLLHLESRILLIEGVQDVTDSKVNGNAANLTLLSEIPVKGAVLLHD